jgi:alpha-ribazole phosphatase
MMVKQVFIVRHGETDYNVTGRWQGHLDIPLNAHGREQARLVGEMFHSLPVGAIYTSDLLRAYDTARAIAHTTRIQVIHADERLREIHCGVFQGLSRQEILETYPLEFNHWENSDAYAVPGGESRLQAQARVYGFWQEMLRAETHENIVLVSHGGTIRWLLNKLFGVEALIGKHFYNTSVTTLQLTAGGWHLFRVGDVGHLEPNQYTEDKRVL